MKKKIVLLAFLMQAQTRSKTGPNLSQVMCTVITILKWGVDLSRFTGEDTCKLSSGTCGETKRTREGEQMKTSPYSQAIAFILFLLLLAVIMIGSYALDSKREPDLMAQSFLNDQPCAAPCWYGLVPGKSSKEEVYRVLAKLPFVDQSTIREMPDYFYGKDIIAIRGEFKDGGGHGVGFGFSESIVEDITFAPHGLSFGDVAQKLGDPDHVRAFLSGDVKNYQIDTFYVRQGVWVRSYQTIGIFGNRYLVQGDKRGVLLAKEMQVDRLTYVSPADSLEEFFASRLSFRPDLVKSILEVISPWPGWGETAPLN